ncbi:MAG: hypothetical protein H8E48_00325, partial [Chloroflexi bacterium]|nr:hypothetical protein [Chloroflexota bacterium]
LFAESDSLAEVYRTKGIPANLIHYVNNVRYAHLKNVDKTALRDQTRGALDLTNETVMLWAGQPDDKNSYLALERLLPSINELGALLLFRPHPRDEYFATGAYTSLLQESKVRYIDVSYFPDITGLVCAADLVATQFSSVAVEAGHLGIPSLYVLFPDLGQQFLLDHKGYRFPPWCNDGCAYLIERENQVQSVLSEALNNQISRKQVCTNFSSRFGSTTEDIEVILQHITRIIEQVNTSTARPAQA